eukprot:11310537-Ditylum_brightwellii.AAC.1
MGDDIRSEMTKVIDNLTTSAITKIDNHTSTQFDAMSNNVSKIITQMNQTSANMMKLFNNATQQHSYPKNPSQGPYNQFTADVPRTQDFTPAPLTQILDHKNPPSHGKTETDPDGFRRFP